MTQTNRSVMGESLYALHQQALPFATYEAQLALADGIPMSKQVMHTTVYVTIGMRSIPTEFLYMPDCSYMVTLLGIDFLAAANIDCDPKTRLWCFRDVPDVKFPLAAHKLSESDACLNSVEVQLRDEEGDALTNDERKQFNSMLQENLSPFAEEGSPTTMAEHRNETGDAAPVATAPYMFPAKWKVQVQQQLDEMFAGGVIEECESPWAAPLVIVPKKSVELCLCVYYRHLNADTTADRYPLPRLEKLLQSAKQTGHMSTLDLKSGCWQIDTCANSGP